MEKEHIVYLSLGSNLENKKLHLENAVKAINTDIGRVSKISSIYETPALGFTGDDFYNICIELYTKLPPIGLIETLLTLEIELGRVRNDYKGYQNRVIDIDIIFYDSLIMNTEKLILPHPRTTERNFVLFPLIEIAEKIVFPNTNKLLASFIKNHTAPKSLKNLTIHI